MVDRGWLNGISDAFEDERVALVGGPCLPEYECAPPDWLEYFWTPTQFGRVNTFLSLVDFGKRKIEMAPSYVYGCNYSIRKDVFFEFGGTNPDYMPESLRYYQGDGESGLNLRLSRSKYKTVYHPDARIGHLIPASRLTPEYFCWRRYFNGIHASYAQIRKQHGVEEVSSKPSIVKRGFRRIIRVISGPLGGPHIEQVVDLPEDIVKVEKAIQESYEKGFREHQEAVRTDPNLLEWILRKDYLGANGIVPQY
jgi:glucosyl-dolichyl phosphate glucuronosyltransferase